MSCKTIRIGTIKIRMHDGVVRILTNVWHVPELKENLISFGIRLLTKVTSILVKVNF